MSSSEVRDGTSNDAFDPMKDQFEQYGSCMMFHLVTPRMPDKRSFSDGNQAVLLGTHWSKKSDYVRRLYIQRYEDRLMHRPIEPEDSLPIGASLIYDPERIEVALIHVKPQDWHQVSEVQNGLVMQGFTLCPSDTDRIVGARQVVAEIKTEE